MVRINTPLLSLGAHGTLGRSVTFQGNDRLKIARNKPIPTDPKSHAQLAWRQVYRDAVAAWHTLTSEEKEAWRGSCPGLTAYQCFMKSELKLTPLPVPGEMTFYPDAHPETSSVDGRVWHDGVNMDWTALRNAAGTHFDDNDLAEAHMMFDSGTVGGNWKRIFRGIFLFDTSGLPDVCTITGVMMSLHGTLKRDDNSCAPDINIYSSAPASNVALEAGDYDSLGTQALAEAIAYADWDIAAYNDFILIDVGGDGFATHDGGTYISKTGVTKLGTRNANYDVADVNPNWGGFEEPSYMLGNFAEGGEGLKPKLVVTYTTPP